MVVFSMFVILTALCAGWYLDEEKYAMMIISLLVSVVLCIVLCLYCMEYAVQQTVGSNYCQECKEVYESEYEYCPQDGCKLIPLVSVMEENRK